MFKRLGSLVLVLTLGLIVYTAKAQVKLDPNPVTTSDISGLQTQIDALAHTWTDPAFVAGDYTASASMTWTVESGDVVTDKYMIIDDLYFAQFDIRNTTVGGTPSNQLEVAIRGGKRAVARYTAISYTDDNGTAAATRCTVAAAGTTIRVTSDLTGGNFSASTDNTRVACQIFFEVEDVP